MRAIVNSLFPWLLGCEIPRFDGGNTWAFNIWSTLCEIIKSLVTLGHPTKQRGIIMRTIVNSQISLFLSLHTQSRAFREVQSQITTIWHSDRKRLQRTFLSGVGSVIQRNNKTSTKQVLASTKPQQNNRMTKPHRNNEASKKQLLKHQAWLYILKSVSPSIPQVSFSIKKLNVSSAQQLGRQLDIDSLFKDDVNNEASSCAPL